MSSINNSIAKPKFKPAIMVAVIILAAAILTGHVGLWILLIAIFALLAGVWFIVKFNPKYNVQAISALGLNLKYNYENALGIDEAKGKVYICTDKPRLFDKDEIRRVETDSYHEAIRNNNWGFTTHKDKNCKLVIHVADVNQPIHTIGFGNKEEMDIWFSRLSVFCNLT